MLGVERKGETMKEENALRKIDVNHLVWQPEKKQSPVLSDVTAMLTSGRFYGIIGPNGAGKTSFVRQLLGLQNKSGGTVTLDEKNIENISRHEMAGKMSFLPQNTGYSVEFTVFDMVAMGREPHRRFFAPLDGEDMKKIEEAMEFTNCSSLKDRRVSQISGGERQRVMIARTIAQDTPWVVLDEPISNLDIRHQAELMQVLERLRREKQKTIVAILHDINLAASFCTHMILMKNGEICMEGTTEEVLTEENLKRAYGIEFDFLRYPDRAMPYIVPRI